MNRHAILKMVILFISDEKKRKKMRPEPGTPKLKPSK